MRLTGRPVLDRFHRKAKMRTLCFWMATGPTSFCAWPVAVTVERHAFQLPSSIKDRPNTRARTPFRRIRRKAGVLGEASSATCWASTTRPSLISRSSPRTPHRGVRCLVGSRACVSCPQAPLQKRALFDALCRMSLSLEVCVNPVALAPVCFCSFRRRTPRGGCGSV